MWVSLLSVVVVVGAVVIALVVWGAVKRIRMGNENTEQDLVAEYTGLGIALGVAFGAALGNVGLGLCFGIVIGAAIGASLKKKQDEIDLDE